MRQDARLQRPVAAGLDVLGGVVRPCGAAARATGRAASARRRGCRTSRRRCPAAVPSACHFVSSLPTSPVSVVIGFFFRSSSLGSAPTRMEKVVSRSSHRWSIRKAPSGLFLAYRVIVKEASCEAGQGLPDDSRCVGIRLSVWRRYANDMPQLPVARMRSSSMSSFQLCSLAADADEVTDGVGGMSPSPKPAAFPVLQLNPVVEVFSCPISSIPAKPT